MSSGAIVIVCLSAHFAMDAVCRARLLYALAHDVPTIPLIVELNYAVDDGWLDEALHRVAHVPIDVSTEEKTTGSSPRQAGTRRRQSDVDRAPREERTTAVPTGASHGRRPPSRHRPHAIGCPCA